MIFLILENIRSSFNVGSFFRTADSVGVKKIFLTGFTPAPENCEKIKKTSIGAEKYVDYVHRRNTRTLIKALQKKGITVYAMESGTNNNIFQKKLKSPAAFVFGNEIKGVSKKIINQSNDTLSIPMKGKKTSLNVSVSVGITLFEAARKFKFV